MTYRSLVVLSVLTGLFAACEAPKPVASTVAEVAPPAATVKKGKTFYYSPFVVQVPESKMAFTTITFKDVGLQRESPEPSDPLLETIAHSIAYRLQATPALDVRQSIVEYDERLIDPSNHLACETHHLYVDVWNSDHTWGYSLWSGCSEADNFAWKEVAIPADADDLPERVRPLADNIAESLAEAHVDGCFNKSC